MQRIRRILMFTVAIGAMAPATGLASPIVGGQVYANGSTVTIDIVSASAAYVSNVSLYSPFAQLIGNNTVSVGSSTNLGGLTIGDELIFGILVTNTGNTFLMGPASRNADLIAHAAVTWITPTLAEIGFEDIFGGGDLDYNDVIIRVEGVTQNPGNNAPEPATMAIWGLAGVSGLIWRRKARKARRAGVT